MFKNTDTQEGQLFTATYSRDWKWDKAHNVQLSPEAITKFSSDLKEGDFILVRNPENDLQLETFGRIDLKPNRDYLDESTVGIGMNLRYSIGVPVDSEVELTITQLARPPLFHRIFRYLIKIRPVICRTRKSVHPDIGFNTCRISEETMDLLGIKEGDRVVVESPTGRTAVKALRLTKYLQEKKQTQINDNPERYPDCGQLLEIEKLAQTNMDLPMIFLDSGRRKQLGISDCPQSGVCQPVYVYRDPISHFLRAINDVAVPVVVGLIGSAIIFPDFLGFYHKLGILGLALVIILLSILYRTRNIALD